MSLFDFWSPQWNREYDSYPRDIDFRFTELVYSDVEFIGDIVESYCSPDALIPNVIITTNNGNPAVFAQWRALRWTPATDPLFPANYIIRHYKVIIYSDAQRTTILETHQGDFKIDDSKLLDEHDWFPSEIIGILPSQSVPLGTKVSIYCDILQPRTSVLELYLSIDNAPFSLIHSLTLTEAVRTKRYSFEYDFNNWGSYTFRFKIRTHYKKWINYWCPATEDYIEQLDAVITVGEQ